MCAFLCYWAGLQARETRGVLEDGANRIQAVAMQEQGRAEDGRGPRIQEIKEDKNEEQ